MKFLSSERLSEHKYKTPEGYLICTDAILARTGKQSYQRNEIFADAADDDTIIEIDRPSEEVFAPETLASFENKPVTVEHPDENVGPDNYNNLAVGFVRDVHKGTVNGQEVMLGTLVITDAKTIEEIENGEHTDLSCGYDCDIIDEANPQQRNIRGNHVALCQQGRAGIARIVDSSSNFNMYKNRIEKAIKNNDKELLKEVKEAIMYATTHKLSLSEQRDLYNMIKQSGISDSVKDSIKDTHDSYLIQSKYNADNYFGNDGYFHLNKHTAMRFNTYEEAAKKARALYNDWQEHVNIVNDSIKDDALPKKGDKYSDGRYTFIITSTYAPFGKLSVIDLVREDGEKYTVGQNEFVRHFRKINDSVKDAMPITIDKVVYRKGNYTVLEYKNNRGNTVWIVVSNNNWHGEKVYTGGGVVEFSKESAIKTANDFSAMNDSVKDDIVFDYTKADLDKAKEMLITAKTDDEKRLIKSLIAKIEFELKSKELNDEDNNNENEDEFIQAHSDAKAMYEEIISREAMTEEEAKRLVYKYFKGKDSIKDNMTSREFDNWSYHAIHRPNDRNKLNRIIDLFYRNGYKLFDYDDEDFYDEFSDAYANASSSLKNQINAIIKDSKLVDNSIKDEQKPYAITPRRRWQSNKKLEQFFTSLEEAKYAKNASEKTDGIDYVVVDTRTMRIVDGKKTFTIKTEDKDNVYITKIRANNTIEAFNKFNNKK